VTDQGQGDDGEPVARHPLTVLLRLNWLMLHVAVVGACVAMWFLARWQWDVAHEDRGGFRNYSYAVEWVVFIVLTVIGWAKFCHDELVPDPHAGVLYGSVEDAIRISEIARAEEAYDPEVAEWNAQFARLHLEHSLKEQGLSNKQVRAELERIERKALS
jgi:type VI protein secretion system component VasK